MSKKIDINQAVKYLSHEGPLAKENPDFEERTAQLELVKNISECFNENKIGVFELKNDKNATDNTSSDPTPTKT
mgnify:CR=1 FL=1